MTAQMAYLVGVPTCRPTCPARIMDHSCDYSWCSAAAHAGRETDSELATEAFQDRWSSADWLAYLGRF